MWPAYKNYDALDGAADNTCYEFVVQMYDLTVDIVGNGSVTLDPAGGTYRAGQVVELTAVPDSGYYFEGWSEDLTGSDNPAYITMDADKNVTATFKEEYKYMLFFPIAYKWSS